MLRAGQADTASDVSRHLSQSNGIEASPQTVRRILRRQGLRARPKQKKPKLTPRHKKARLLFAEKYKKELDYCRLVAGHFFR